MAIRHGHNQVKRIHLRRRDIQDCGCSLLFIFQSVSSEYKLVRIQQNKAVCKTHVALWTRKSRENLECSIALFRERFHRQTFANVLMSLMKFPPWRSFEGDTQEAFHLFWGMNLADRSGRESKTNVQLSLTERTRPGSNAVRCYCNAELNNQVQRTRHLTRA